MERDDGPRLLRIVVSDEETGEEVATATGVEALVLLAAPDIARGEDYLHILLGDGEVSVELLFDVLRAVIDRMGRGTTFDLSSLLDDDMLLEMTEGLPTQ
jgi:hypothetical protein